MEGERKRMIKLFCPSLSKVAQVVARDEQRLDLGSIARTFSLDPATLKLNGHFISRGVDLIASSVTWKSLISFFSSRGLSTGTNGSGALLVDGKLSNSGFKRAHDSAVVEDGTPSSSYQGYNNISAKHQLEDVNIRGNKRFRESGLDSEKVTKYDAFSLKRKHFTEDVNSLKRIRGDESSLGF